MIYFCFYLYVFHLMTLCLQKLEADGKGTCQYFGLVTASSALCLWGVVNCSLKLLGNLHGTLAWMKHKSPCSFYSQVTTNSGHVYELFYYNDSTSLNNFFFHVQVGYKRNTGQKLSCFLFNLTCFLPYFQVFSLMILIH